MDFSFLAEADRTTLQFEKAKRNLENAKLELEAAKKAYDELLARADEMGVPKAKLKKLTEDRIQALFESGLLDFVEKPTNKTTSTKATAAKTKSPKGKDKRDKKNHKDAPDFDEIAAMIAAADEDKVAEAKT